MADASTTTDRTPAALWVTRVALLATAFTADGLVATHALRRPGSADEVLIAAAWLVWGAAAVASGIRRRWALTMLRMALSAGLVGLCVAMARSVGAPWSAVVGLVIAWAAWAAAMSPSVGAWYINADSYGAEYRVALRPPLVVALVTTLLWVAAAALTAAGIIGAVQGSWWLAVPAFLIGAAGVAVTAHALYRVSSRVCVFVPNGLTLIDALAISDPLFISRTRVREIVYSSGNEAGLLDPETGDEMAGCVDLSRGAVGSGVRLELTGAVDVARVGDRPEVAELLSAHVIRLVPTSTDLALRAAADRGYRVTTAPPRTSSGNSAS